MLTTVGHVTLLSVCQIAAAAAAIIIIIIIMIGSGRGLWGLDGVGS
jgi:hypothetical protein